LARLTPLLHSFFCCEQVPQHKSVSNVHNRGQSLEDEQEIAFDNADNSHDNAFQLDGHRSLEEGRGKPKICACQYAHQPYRTCRKRYSTLIGSSCKSLCKSLSSKLGPERMVSAELPGQNALTKKQIRGHIKALDISCKKLVKPMSTHLQLQGYSTNKKTVETLLSYFHGMDYAQNSLNLGVWQTQRAVFNHFSFCCCTRHRVLRLLAFLMSLFCYDSRCVNYIFQPKFTTGILIHRNFFCFGLLTVR
jgi:hypothetical protein